MLPSCSNNPLSRGEVLQYIDELGSASSGDTPMSRVSPAIVALVIVWGAPGLLRAQSLPVEARPSVAVLPLPNNMRSEAGVFLESPSGEITRVRESQNGFSCILRDHSERFGDIVDARCYSDDLWPALLRRWDLDNEYDTVEEVYAQVHREIEVGRLSLPTVPTAGYRIRGSSSSIDAEGGVIVNDLDKWQSIHFPFRTAEEMGLTEDREPSLAGNPGQMPFVMASGTWWSHVMIVHAPEND